MDFTLQLIVVMACAITVATVVVYERLLREARYEHERLMADCDLFSELLNEAMERHPSTKPRHLFPVVDGA